MEYVTLANDVKMPILGLGVFQVPDAAQCEQAVADAFGAGYRSIDTAAGYGNERGVGEGIRSCGIAREELFVTTKLAAEIKNYKEAAEAIDGSLKAMELDYIDMMLIHSPQPWKDFRGGNYL